MEKKSVYKISGSLYNKLLTIHFIVTDILQIKKDR